MAIFFQAEDKIKHLEARVAELEALVHGMASGRERLDQALRELSARTAGHQPNTTFLNERLRGYEQLTLNVKQMGYDLARGLARARLGRVVSSPGDAPLTSSLSKQADFESDWFAFWCAEILAAPIYHRKLWELCYIAQALRLAGKLTPGQRGLAFGIGEEPLPALFAKYGCHILATDLDPDRPEARAWRQTSQHGALEKLRRSDICPDETAMANIAYRDVDMNDIPRDLDGQFDFCWSACALEHLGSLEQGMAFIENTMRTLKPGGVAVHTTEYNLDDDSQTIDSWPTVLYQRRHIEGLLERLSRAGHHAAPVDFTAGDQILDGLVDLPPWLPGPSPAHVKLLVDGFPCTSIGLIIRKAG